MSPQEALHKLPPKSIPVLLEKLVAIHRQSMDDPDTVSPIVTLHLRNGRAESGWVLGQTLDEKYGEYLLFHPAGGDFQHPQADAMYIPMGIIEAVTVHSIVPVAHLLSFGAITSPVGVEPPTRLVVRSRTEQMAQATSADIGAPIAFEVSFDGVADSGEPLGALLEAVKETTSVIKALAQDAMGKEAFAKSVKKVQFAEGPKAAVLDHGTLRITAQFAQGANGRLAKPALRTAISSLL